MNKPNYHTTKLFTESLLATKKKKKKKKMQVLMNKPGYLQISILELSKMLIFMFWFNYVKPKMVKK